MVELVKKLPCNCNVPPRKPHAAWCNVSLTVDQLNRGRDVFLRNDVNSFVSWHPGAETAFILGNYSADELVDLAAFMKLGNEL